jgi:uncharacterized protein
MPSPHRILDPAKPESFENRCALAVMTKVPRAGRVKTRLVPPLSPEEAAELNICFLRDTAAAIQLACARGAVGVAVYTPVGLETAYSNILPANFRLLPQRGDGFGERLAFATEDLFRCGFSSVCLIDSDSPTVPADVYAQAVHLLAAPGDSVVLGPSDDGGYYLIGVKKHYRALFERIDWSTDRVFEQTRSRARELDVKVELLPNGYDIDDRASLNRLCEELVSDRVSAELAVHTRNFLAAFVKGEGRRRIFAPQ